MIKKTLSLLTLALFFGGCSSIAVVPQDLTTLTEYEYNLHQGNIYSTQAELSIPSTDTPQYISAVTKDKEVHLYERRIYAETTGNALDVEIKLYEGGSHTGGVKSTNYNLLRSGGDNSTFEIYAEATPNLNLATQLPLGNKILSDKKYSESIISTTEYILKPNTTYILEVHNLDGGVATTSFNWFWSEE